MDINEILSQLHNALGEELLNRVKSGEASSSELNVARQFLKDNYVEEVASAGSVIAELYSQLENSEDAFFDAEADKYLKN